jgi:hypothetical protein
MSEKEYAVSAAPVCGSIVHEEVCARALVTVRPTVTPGEVSVVCEGEPSLHRCPGAAGDSCRFVVHQNLCVQIPLFFSAGVRAMPEGVVCGAPGIGGCPAVSGCTRTLGYYRNHPQETNELIARAGGSVVLGAEGEGAGYTVTALNAGAVLSLDTPAPPAPLSPPFLGEYRQLYAQLLTADLNILAGAVCMNAVLAVNAANNFLETSEPGVGKAGAPEMSEPLAVFNEGRAQGCPGHC